MSVAIVTGVICLVVGFIGGFVFCMWIFHAEKENNDKHEN